MYRNTFRFLITPVLALAVLRASLKLLFIDTTTGFYSGGGVLPVLYTAVAVFTIAGAALLIKRENDPGMSSFRGNGILEITGIALGIVLIGVNGLHLARLLSEPFVLMEVNVMPRPLRLVCYTAGVISGALLAWIAATSLSGVRRNNIAGYASLVISVWHSLYMIDRFITFRQASTVSDQFIETVYMLFATFFWLAHAKCIAGVDMQRKRVVLCAAGAVVLGIPLVAGQFFASVILGAVSGPAFTEILLIAASCVYFAVFAMAAVFSPTVSGSED